jgi:DNA-binding transcriptional regulator of glucitol operon
LEFIASQANIIKILIRQFFSILPRRVILAYLTKAMISELNKEQKRCIHAKMKERKKMTCFGVIILFLAGILCLMLLLWQFIVFMVSASERFSGENLDGCISYVVKENVFSILLILIGQIGMFTILMKIRAKIIAKYGKNSADLYREVKDGKTTFVNRWENARLMNDEYQICVECEKITRSTRQTQLILVVVLLIMFVSAFVTVSYLFGSYNFVVTDVRKCLEN